MMHNRIPRVTRAGTNESTHQQQQSAFAPAQVSTRDDRTWPRQLPHGFTAPMHMPSLPVAAEAIIHDHAQNTILGFGRQSAEHIQADLAETLPALIDQAVGTVNDAIAIPLQDCIAQHTAAIKGVAQREEHVFRTVEKACAAYATERMRIVSEIESLLEFMQREAVSSGDQDKVVDAVASDYAAQADQLANAATMAASGRLASFLASR